jgi:hypothetical protein
MNRRPDALDTWVLAGQSNMQGRAWLRGALQPDRRVWSFSSAGLWEQAEEPLHRLWESFTPVHQALMRDGMTPAEMAVSDQEYARREAAERTIGAGLGIAFGKAMADALRRPIGLIPAAHGGTSLGQWCESRKGVDGLYGAMLERIRRAGGRLRGVLWYQGESDAAELADATSYGERLDRWITALRVDTGIPALPIVAAQIGRVLPPSIRADRITAWDYVKEALATLPQRTPATAVTSAVDLPLTDSIHVSTSGLIRLGRRMARLALRLTERPDIAAGPRIRSIEPWLTPSGQGNGLRIRFQGTTGAWSRTEMIRGFALHAEEGDGAGGPPVIVNAWTDEEAADGSVLLLLDRLPLAGERISYAFGTDPLCDLVDGADMPLCAFMPRRIVPD